MRGPISGPCGTTLLRTIVVGIAAYLVLIAVVRICGKRTLSKFNAFDFVVTVSLGSTLATVLRAGNRRSYARSRDPAIDSSASRRQGSVKRSAARVSDTFT
jgi:hypothetical protein